jgi:glyoxylase-like metal-dependent hydrolase (beta-lactamase superfamily II)
MIVQRRDALQVFAIAFLLLLSSNAAVQGRLLPGSQNSTPTTNTPESVRSFHVQGNIWMISGAGGNITVQVSDAKAAGPGAGEGVLLVDTGRRDTTAAVLAELQKITPKRIEYIVNTHVDADHVGGNEVLAKPRMDFLWTPGMVTGPGVKVIGHENTLRRISSAEAGYPAIARPTHPYSARQRKIYFNDEPIVIMHEAAARTDGDSIVFFRKSDVISAGDIFQTTTYPVIDPAQGGSISGIITALDDILDLMVPRYNQEGGTLVIPGHGRVSDQHDVLEYRDMLVIVRDRIQHTASKGMTLPQIKALRPTVDYDARWGTASGAWTTDKFIEAIYAEVARQR